MATPSSRLNVNAVPWEPNPAFPPSPAADFTMVLPRTISRSSSDISVDKHISPLSVSESILMGRKSSPLILTHAAANTPLEFCAAPTQNDSTHVASPVAADTKEASCEEELGDDMIVYEPPQRAGVVHLGMAFVPEQYAHDEHYIMQVLQDDELANHEPYVPYLDSDEDSLDDEQMAWLETQLRAKEDTYDEIYF